MIESDLKSTKQRTTILSLIYRFRFVTTKQLQSALDLKYQQSVQPRLNQLVEHGFIGRNYSAAHRLAGLPASYFLLPNGIAAVKQLSPDADKQALHNAYYDKSANESFIRHCLAVGDVHQALAQTCGDRLDFFTRTEAGEYDYFPDPLPDAYVAIRDPARLPHDPAHYFLEVADIATPAFVYKKRLSQYAAFAEDGSWEDATGTTLPPVLIVTELPAQQAKLQKLTDRQLEITYAEDLKIMVVAKESLADI